MATEGVFSALVSMTTGQVRIKSGGHARHKSSDRIQANELDAAEREAVIKARRQRREERGSNAVDILYRLQV